MLVNRSDNLYRFSIDKWLDLVNHVQVFKMALFVCNNHKSADIYWLSWHVFCESLLTRVLRFFCNLA